MQKNNLRWFCKKNFIFLVSFIFSFSKSDFLERNQRWQIYIIEQDSQQNQIIIQIFSICEKQFEGFNSHSNSLYIKWIKIYLYL